MFWKNCVILIVVSFADNVFFLYINQIFHICEWKGASDSMEDIHVSVYIVDKISGPLDHDLDLDINKLADQNMTMYFYL